MKTLVYYSLRLLALAVTLSLAPVSARAEVSELRVGVRASVDYPGMKKPTEEQLQQAKAHQSIYVISQVRLVDPIHKPDHLVKPVNEAALAHELRQTLAAHGYVEASAHGPKPEIVLMVDYGRGWLKNVYLGKASQSAGVEGSATYLPTYSVSFEQLLDQKTPGYEEKLQRADEEKLVIVVTAFKYPSSPKEKPQRLWKTTMHVDDPEHRDLNVMMKEMFAAGGAYFGRLNEGKEAEVWKPLPEGHVTLGETKVLEEVKPAPKK